MTFDEIIIREPRIIPLIADCYYLSCHPNKSLKQVIFDKLIRPKVSQLVGWYCDGDKLKESEIYDLVNQTLIKILNV